MPSVKIATFNVNGIRPRLQTLLQWLEHEQPDVVCLQELKIADDLFPAAQIRAAGYGAVWHGQRAWNGVAVLARGADPVEIRRGLAGASDDDQSRYLEAAVFGLAIGCLYLPNGNPQPGPKFDYKLAWFDRLIRHAAALLKREDHVVLAGDFNVVPTDELDIYNSRSWKKDALLQPESRDCWEKLLKQGWTDAIRELYPDQRIFTFWDYFRNHFERGGGLRIDHLLLSPKLSPYLQAGGVDRWVRGQPKPSDHAPTWIQLGAASNKASRSTRRKRRK